MKKKYVISLLVIVVFSFGFVFYQKWKVNNKDSTYLSQCRSNIIQIRSALSTYRENYGTLPDSLLEIPEPMLYKYCLLCPTSQEFAPLKDEKTDYVYTPNNPKKIITEAGKEFYTILYCKPHYKKGYIVGLFADSPEGTQIGFIPTGVKKGTIYDSSERLNASKENKNVNDKKKTASLRAEPEKEKE